MFVKHTSNRILKCNLGIAPSLSDGSEKVFRLEVRTVGDVFWTDSSVLEPLLSRSVREKLQSK